MYFSENWASVFPSICIVVLFVWWCGFFVCWCVCVCVRVCVLLLLLFFVNDDDYNDDDIHF